MFDHMIAQPSLLFAKGNKFQKKKNISKGISHESGPKFPALLHINHISLQIMSDITFGDNIPTRQEKDTLIFPILYLLSRMGKP